MSSEDQSTDSFYAPLQARWISARRRSLVSASARSGEMANVDEPGPFEHWAGGLFPGDPLARQIGGMLDGSEDTDADA